MAPPASGRKAKNVSKGKNDAKTLKRKRDVEDHEKLQKSVDELVSAAMQFLPYRHLLTLSGCESRDQKLL